MGVAERALMGAETTSPFQVSLPPWLAMDGCLLHDRRYLPREWSTWSKIQIDGLGQTTNSRFHLANRAIQPLPCCYTGSPRYSHRDIHLKNFAHPSSHTRI